MATLFVTGSGFALLPLGADAFDPDTLPARVFTQALPDVLDAFGAGTYGAPAITATTLSGTAAGGAFTFTGTGFTKTSGTIRQIDFVTDDGSLRIACNARWSAARGGVYSNTISSVAAEFGGTEFFMSGKLSWAGGGLAGRRRRCASPRAGMCWS